MPAWAQYPYPARKTAAGIPYNLLYSGGSSEQHHSNTWSAPSDPSMSFHGWSHYCWGAPRPGVLLAFFKMCAAYAHLTQKCVRAAKICVSVYYRSNYHLGQKHEQQIQARVQTYSLNQSFPAIAAFELNSSNY